MSLSYISVELLKSCKDSRVTYAQFDNVRFIYRDGDYVGWYAC